MKRRVMGLLLAVLLLAVATAGLAREAAEAREVASPGFNYYSLGTEDAAQVVLRYGGVRVGGGLFLLEDGYLSLAYEQDDDTIAPLEAGARLTYLNSDLSVRWVLEDERLEGALYTELRELDGTLLLGNERKLPGEAQEWVSSLMLVDRATGHIRWQLENVLGERLNDCWGDEAGLVYAVTSDIQPEEETSGGHLFVLDEEGGLVWEVSYLAHYGVEGLWGVCPLGGDSLLLYGTRAQGEIVLYTDRQGNVLGWFASSPGTRAPAAIPRCICWRPGKGRPTWPAGRWSAPPAIHPTRPGRCA